MDNVTVITLGPRGTQRSGEVQAGATFEEAFGEYSNVFGRKARARRKKRRLERIANKREVKLARIEARDAVRSERKKRRIGRRAEAQKLRQEKRRSGMERRQEKRIARKQFRMKRRAIGDEPEEDEEDIDMQDEGGMDTGGPSPRPVGPGSDYTEDETETGGGSVGGGSIGGGGTTAPMPEEEETGGGYSGGGQTGGGYYEEEETSGGYSGGGQTSGGYSGGGYEEDSGEEWGGGPPSMQDEGGAEGEEWGGTGSVYTNDNNDEGAAEGTGESDFDGVLNGEDNFSEFNDMKINPKIRAITDKIEWNKEFIDRLVSQKAKRISQNKDYSDIDREVEARKQRIANLENKLKQYANFEGDYSLQPDSGDYYGVDAFDYADGQDDYYGINTSRSNVKSNADGIYNEYAEADGDSDYYGIDAFDFADGGSFDTAFDFADGSQRMANPALAKGRMVRTTMSIKRRPNPKMVAKRNREIAAARIQAIRKKNNKLGKVTPVAAGLNPSFSPNQIVIPAASAGDTATNPNIKTYKVIKPVAIKIKYNSNLMQLAPVSSGASGIYNKDTIIKGEPITLPVKTGNNLIQYPLVKVEGTTHYVKQVDVELVSNFDGERFGMGPAYMENPGETLVTLGSNFEGDRLANPETQKTKINWKSVAIGVGVAAVAIWAIRKYKVFEK